jgi:pyruvate-formate lyase-activating enzyme
VTPDIEIQGGWSLAVFLCACVLACSWCYQSDKAADIARESTRRECVKFHSPKECK